MVKRLFALFCIIAFAPFLSGCQSVQIESKAGSLGHRADALKKYVGDFSNGASVEIKSNVIYLGREYENNTFGPARIKFVFEK